MSAVRWSAARSAVSAVARLSLNRAGRGTAVVLAYHDVVAERRPASRWTVSADQLRSHVVLLRRLGHRIVPLSLLSGLLRMGAPVGGLAAITFDDALAGVARHAAPVLAELDAPATVAVVTGGLGRDPAWWPGSGPVMSVRDLHEWVAAGLGVAAHSRTHASLPGLNAVRLRAEVSGARTELEDLTGHSVDAFAYPYGHHDERARREVADAGYATAYTFLNGRVTGAEDPHRLPRLTMGCHVEAWRLAYHLGRAPGTWPDHQQQAVTGVEALT